MKKNNKVLLGISLLVAVVLAGAYSASKAYQGDYSQKGPNYSEERHEAMEEAFGNNDYNAWKELMEKASHRRDKTRVSQAINEDNFSKFTEAHKLMEEGKYEEANQIREELGLRTRNGERVGARRGQGKGAPEGFNSENRGKNRGGNFIDVNKDGRCDNLN